MIIPILRLKELEEKYQKLIKEYWQGDNTAKKGSRRRDILEAEAKGIRETLKDEWDFLEELLKWDIDKEDATMDKPIKDRIAEIKEVLGDGK